MAFDINESIKYQSWLNRLNPIGKCFVRVKYKPEYYNGASEILRWNTEAGVAAFWRDEKTPEGMVVTSIWWRWIEDFDILLYDPTVYHKLIDYLNYGRVQLK